MSPVKKPLICYLFDRLHVEAQLSRERPIIGPAVSKWYEGNKPFLIAFSDKDRPAIEVLHNGDLYYQVERLIEAIKEPIQWKLWIKGDEAKNSIAPLGLDCDVDTRG
jgi:hypothetical protein